MALKPIDETHALQIQAGTLGRQNGHQFEDQIAIEANDFLCPHTVGRDVQAHVSKGNPTSILIDYVCNRENITVLAKLQALSTGALATSEEGKRWLSVNGTDVRRCKSDIILTLYRDGKEPTTVGISTKQCNNSSPTNAQLYFTTASAFVNLLRGNKIDVSQKAENALKQFCGEPGFRPSDSSTDIEQRKTDPRRYFWEELDSEAKAELEELLQKKHDDIFRLLLQKAYQDDPFVPSYVVHKTKKSKDWNSTEIAIYSVSELIALSKKYKGFETREYTIRKGSFKDPIGVTHQAPRFGIIQMQRGGQKQHPTQLQFNLEAGYFYNLVEELDQIASDSIGK